MGSTCDDYETFIKKYAVNQPLKTYLWEAEAQIHGKSLSFQFYILQKQNYYSMSVCSLCGMYEFI
jgi:hypothetical protein